MVNFLKHFNNKNIFLFDAMGALTSLIMTGIVLPLFSEQLGLTKYTLYGMALFPLIYCLYSITCFLLPQRKSWMLPLLIFANSFYCFVSASVMMWVGGIALIGYLFLTSEVLVLLGVIFIEWTVYKTSLLDK